MFYNSSNLGSSLVSLSRRSSPCSTRSLTEKLSRACLLLPSRGFRDCHIATCKELITPNVRSSSFTSCAPCRSVKMSRRCLASLPQGQLANKASSELHPVSSNKTPENLNCANVTVHQQSGARRAIKTSSVETNSII